LYESYLPRGRLSGDRERERERSRAFQVAGVNWGSSLSARGPLGGARRPGDVFRRAEDIVRGDEDGGGEGWAKGTLCMCWLRPKISLALARARTLSRFFFFEVTIESGLDGST
jgi:hypothetical protein